MKQYNSFSRFLASLLCVLLCVGMLPLTAFATGDAARAGKTPGIRAVKYSYDGAEWSDLTAGTILTGQTVYLCALFTPAESLAPLNPAASTFTLDGTEVGAGEIYGSADAPEGIVLCLNGEGGIAVANGQHTVTVTLTDTDGASVSESVSFITLCDTNSMTALAFAPVSGALPTLGETFSLYLTTNEYRHLYSIPALTVRLDARFPVEDVIFGDGVTGNWTYTPGTDGTATLTVRVPYAAMTDYRKVESGFRQLVAEIRLGVPTDLPSGVSLWWLVPDCSFSARAHSADTEPTEAGLHSFSVPRDGLTVTAGYTLNVPTLLTGETVTLKVTDVLGQPAAGVEILCDDTQSVGITDGMGRLTTDLLTGSAAAHTLYARDAEGNRSFTVSATCYDPADISAVPTDIRPVAVNSPTASKSFVWTSGIRGSAPSAMARVSLTPAFDDENATVLTVEGKSEVVGFADTLQAVRVNRVDLEGLRAGTTYYCQVGDGTTWSEVFSFTTMSRGLIDTNFFVLGDISETTVANLDTISGFMQASGLEYAFCIQTGDALSQVNAITAWDSLQAALSSGIYASTDLLHAVGDRETVNGNRSPADISATERHANGFSYVEYGCVYAATIDYTTDPLRMEKALESLVSSAKSSYATWKVLTVHMPVWQTDPANRESARFADEIAAACERAGIHMVFSGNDQSYARTYPLLGGEQNEDGVVYLSVGSVGERTHGISRTDKFAVATTAFHSVVLSVEASEASLTVRAYDIDTNGNARLLDTYTIDSPYCRDGIHDMVPDMTASPICLTCTRCGMTCPLDQYAGLFRDGEYLYYEVFGTITTGWVSVGDDWYYFGGESKTAVDGEQTIDGYTYRFENHVLVAGQWYRTEAGELLLRWAGHRHPAGWAVIEGKTYCFDSQGVAYTGNAAVRTNRDLTEYCTFDENGVFVGTVTEGLFISPGLIVYLVDGTPIEAGMVRDEQENLYFINSTCKAVRGYYAVPAKWSNGLVIPSFYEFDDDFRLIEKDGIYHDDWLGQVYYFIDSVPQAMGLVQDDEGHFLYFQPKFANHPAVVNRDFKLTARMTNGLVEPGIYHFDENGFMVIPEEPITEPETLPETPPETTPSGDPVTETENPGTDPADTDPTDPETTSDSTPVTEPATDPDTETVTTPASETVTTPQTDPVTKQTETGDEPETIVTPVTTPSGDVVTTPEGDVVTRVETVPVATQPGASETETQKSARGCNSSLTAASAILALLIPAAFISLRRKRHDCKGESDKD